MVEYISTDDAPKAIGPYSQGVVSGTLIFTSGQIPLDPSTNQMIEGGFGDKVRRVFENLKAVLESAGASLSDVVRVTVYLSDLGDFQELNGIYAEYMGEHRPSRSTVQVAALPLGSPVEIDMIATREG